MITILLIIAAIGALTWVACMIWLVYEFWTAPLLDEDMSVVSDPHDRWPRS